MHSQIWMLLWCTKQMACVPVIQCLSFLFSFRPNGLFLLFSATTMTTVCNFFRSYLWKTWRGGLNKKDKGRREKNKNKQTMSTGCTKKSQHQKHRTHTRTSGLYHLFTYAANCFKPAFLSWLQPIIISQNAKKQNWYLCKHFELTSQQCISADH